MNVQKTTGRKFYTIALGANVPSDLGSPRDTLESALKLLETFDICIRSRARWHRSAAWPPGSGPDFVNGAAEIGARGDPGDVLRVLHEIERRLGRTRDRRWEPRACDLDLLAEEATVLPDAATARAWMDLSPEEQATRAPGELILPHPRMHQRAFVLAPLAEIRPDWVHPLLGRDVRAMLADLPESDRAAVTALRT